MKEICNIPISEKGFLKIKDAATGEILVDTTNDILYGNLAAALAHSLIGDQNAFLSYIAFGNGGAFIDPTGAISYKPSFGGPGSLIKNLSANLYNTIYVKKLTNSFVIFDPASSASIGAEDVSTNYEDIIIDVTMGYNEPPVGVSGVPSTTILQTQIDNSAFVGTTVPTTGAQDPSTLVFNEIGLFVGSDAIFAGNYTGGTNDVANFVSTTANFTPPTQSKLMCTHVIFSPIQKSQNRSLSFEYTLRIQMGT
jgi:hypothetical protein